VGAQVITVKSGFGQRPAAKSAYGLNRVLASLSTCSTYLRDMGYRDALLRIKMIHYQLRAGLLGHGIKVKVMLSIMSLEQRSEVATSRLR